MQIRTARLGLALLAGLLAGSLVPALASAHGAATTLYRTRVLEVTPADLPVDVRITRGDQIRFENAGDEELVICGYATDRCEGWVKLGPGGVYVDEHSESYYANRDGERQGDIPEGAGEGKPDFQLVRREPAFYAYHDHRVHWMGGSTLPPNVDEGDPSPQRVYDGRVQFRYGDTTGEVHTRLEYVGGRTWLARYGEYGLTVFAVLAMLVVFVVDARRRRARVRDAVEGSDDDGRGEVAPG